MYGKVDKAIDDLYEQWLALPEPRPEWTLREIANRIGCSMQRIQAISAAAEAKLRKNTLARHIYAEYILGLHDMYKLDNKFYYYNK